MLKRLFLIAALAAVFGPPAVAAGLRLSFAAPEGWRLDPGASTSKKTYYLRRAAKAEPRCSIGLGAEDTASLASAQNAMLSRLRTMLTGPSEPRIRRSTLRSHSGVRILKAEVLFDHYSQPQYRRGTIYPLRGVYYSFQSRSDDRIYSIECWPEIRYGSYFDQALDDLARSIAF